jgi:hypothetical protein
MTNFGIIMEIKDIEDPFKWSRDVVNKLQSNGTGLYYSPSREPSNTSEKNTVSATPINLDTLTHVVEPVMEGYFKYIWDFIQDMKKIFPTLGDDWGVYIPEVKYLSPEPLVYHSDLALIEYPDVHFVGDALSARGITVSGAQGILSVLKLITPIEDEWDKFAGLLIYNKNEYEKALQQHRKYCEWIETRNINRWTDQENKVVSYDSKNLLHTFRLLMSGENILRYGFPLVRFEGEQRDYLMKIRAGEFKYEELMAEVEKRMAGLEELYKTSTIPHSVDTKKIEALYREVSTWPI